MKKIINQLKSSVKFQKALYIICSCLLSFYVFTIPSFSGRVGLSFIPYVGIILLSISSLLFFLLYRKPKISFSLFILPLFVLHALIGTIIYSHQFRPWLTLVLMLVSYFVFLITFECIDNKFMIINIISLSLFLFSIYFFLHYRTEILNFSSLIKTNVRLGKDFNNVNQLGSFMSVGVACSLFSIFFWKRKIKYLLFIPLISFLAVGLFTGSRTFILSILVIVIVLVFFKLKKHKLIFFISFLGIIITTIVLINLPPFEFIKNQFLRFFVTILSGGESSDLSSMQRGVWQLYGFDLAGNRFVFGYGNGGFGIASYTGSYAHANFAELMCDYGLVGFCIFYFYLLYNCYLSISDRENTKYLIIVLVCYFAINGFLSVYYYQKDVYLIFALFYYLNKHRTLVPNKKLQGCFLYKISI